MKSGTQNWPSIGTPLGPRWDTHTGCAHRQTPRPCRSSAGSKSHLLRSQPVLQVF